MMASSQARFVPAAIIVRAAAVLPAKLSRPHAKTMGVYCSPSVQLSEMKPLLKGFGGTARLVERRALPRKLFRDRELRREVVVKAAGLGGASGLNVARRHGLVAHFPE